MRPLLTLITLMFMSATLAGCASYHSRTTEYAPLSGESWSVATRTNGRSGPVYLLVNGERIAMVVFDGRGNGTASAIGNYQGQSFSLRCPSDRPNHCTVFAGGKPLRARAAAN